MQGPPTRHKVPQTTNAPGYVKREGMETSENSMPGHHANPNSFDGDWIFEASGMAEMSKLGEGPWM